MNRPYELLAECVAAIRADPLGFLAVFAALAFAMYVTGVASTI